MLGVGPWQVPYLMSARLSHFMRIFMSVHRHDITNYPQCRPITNMTLHLLAGCGSACPAIVLLPSGEAVEVAYPNRSWMV